MLWILIGGFLLFGTSGLSQASNGETPPTLLDTTDYLLYLPTGFNTAQKHPLVFGLMNTGEAQPMMAAWRDAAEKYQWVIVISKTFRNEISGNEFARLIPTLQQVIADPAYAVDPSRVILSGMSGGVRAGYQLLFDHPELFAGIVANTGMMDPSLELGHPQDYPRSKLAVLLSSKVDFRRNDMIRDKALLENLGWKIQWIDFWGNHRLAQPEKYVAAAGWLQDQFPAATR